jgi:hypothetical protein
MSFSRRKVSLIVGLIVLAFNALVSLQVVEAQKPIAASTRPFEPTEELFYEAEFNRVLLRGLNVAEFKLRSVRSPMTSEEDKKAGKPYLLTFTADVVSKGFFTRLFNLKFHEQIESTVEATSFTIQKTTILDEQGKRVRATETTYDRSTGKMSWSQHDPNNPSAEPRRAVVDFSGQLQDVLSAVYFIRTRALHVGKPFEIFIGESGRIFRIPVYVVEKKSMKTVLGRVKVVRVEPQLFGPDRLIKDEDGQFSVWITDDDRHIPVSARVKTDYGTFDIKLKRADVNKL